MKIYVNNMNKRINLSVNMADYITQADSKLVKVWMADTKSDLEAYVNAMVAKAERDLQIGITDVYELAATYYNSYEMPVVTIIGRGYDRRPDSDLSGLYVEAFTSEDEGTVENRYTRAC